MVYEQILTVVLVDVQIHNFCLLIPDLVLTLAVTKNCVVSALVDCSVDSVSIKWALLVTIEKIHVKTGALNRMDSNKLCEVCRVVLVATTCLRHLNHILGTQWCSFKRLCSTFRIFVSIHRLFGNGHALMAIAFSFKKLVVADVEVRIVNSINGISPITLSLNDAEQLCYESKI